MMTSYELHAIVREAMTKAGFVKQDRIWRKCTDELLWLVQLDRSPYGERFSFDIGVTPLGSLDYAAPTKAGDSPILVHLENLPLVAPQQISDARFSDFRSSVIRGLDLTSDVECEERRQLIASIIETLGEYIGKVSSKQELRARYQAGDLKSAFIRKDVEQLFAES